MDCLLLGVAALGAWFRDRAKLGTENFAYWQ